MCTTVWCFDCVDEATDFAGVSFDPAERDINGAGAFYFLGDECVGSGIEDLFFFTIGAGVFDMPDVGEWCVCLCEMANEVLCSPIIVEAGFLWGVVTQVSESDGEVFDEECGLLNVFEK